MTSSASTCVIQSPCCNYTEFIQFRIFPIHWPDPILLLRPPANLWSQQLSERLRDIMHMYLSACRYIREVSVGEFRHRSLRSTFQAAACNGARGWRIPHYVFQLPWQVAACACGLAKKRGRHSTVLEVGPLGPLGSSRPWLAVSFF